MVFDGLKQLDIWTTDPQVKIRAVTAGIDLELDTQDFAAGRKMSCPLLVIVGRKLDVFLQPDALPDALTKIQIRVCHGRQ